MKQYRIAEVKTCLMFMKAVPAWLFHCNVCESSLTVIERSLGGLVIKIYQSHNSRSCLCDSSYSSCIPLLSTCMVSQKLQTVDFAFILQRINNHTILLKVVKYWSWAMLGLFIWCITCNENAVNVSISEMKNFVNKLLTVLHSWVQMAFIRIQTSRMEM